MLRSSVAAMDEIEQSPKEITGIIGVIDDIAFQTICSRSMPALKPHEPVKGSLSLPRRSVNLRSVQRKLPTRSKI